ncbi:MAG: LLM class flavin-dependent oxidoreductase, partial [Thaumarchaeota archaeon]|nr:LLM class flavin-dependent oxidoreductase [Nitrososphaerota archaeon]
QAPSVWPWLGAALASSSKIKIGPAVTVPIGGRYNPILVGQAAATLDNMFPGRFLLGVGTGQAMSEERFLGRWPDWKERGARLREGISLIRKLWEAGDYFDWEGAYFRASKIYLYTRPAGPIEIYVSARGKYAARIAGSLGDHLMTTVSDPEKVKNEIIPEFERALRKTGRDPARAFRIGYVEFGIGDVDALVKMLKEGSAAQGLVEAARNEMDPRKIQQMGSAVSAEDLIRFHHLVRRADELIPTAQSLIDAGCNYIVFSDESRHPNENMKKLKEEVIPHLRAA